MTEHLETLKSLHAEEKVKLVSTSAQQSKLIDFLQSKAESKTSKWKVCDDDGDNGWRDENIYINIFPFV